jgi:HEAT repeat protein
LTIREVFIVRFVLCAALPALALLAAGCGEPAAMTAGGKPVSHWLQALQDPDARVRKKAVTKLGNVGTADPAAIPAVAAALKDRDARVRVEAALALLKLGPAAKEAEAALAEAARTDPDGRVRDCAARALANVQGTRRISR